MYIYYFDFLHWVGHLRNQHNNAIIFFWSSLPSRPMNCRTVWPILAQFSIPTPHENLRKPKGF